jgi:hypothetical protein
MKTSIRTLPEQETFTSDGEDNPALVLSHNRVVLTDDGDRPQLLAMWRDEEGAFPTFDVVLERADVRRMATFLARWLAATATHEDNATEFDAAVAEARKLLGIDV